MLRSFGNAKVNFFAQRATSLRNTEDSSERHAAENEVARAAAEMICIREGVFLGAGRITHKIIPQLVSQDNLSLLVHDLAMFATLSQFVEAEFSLTGGMMQEGEPGLFGPIAEQAVKAFSIDACFLEISHIDSEGRVLSPYHGANRLYKVAIEHAKRLIGLGHRVNFAGGDGVNLCELRQFHTIILSTGDVVESLDIFRKQGFTLSVKTASYVVFVRV